MVQSRLSSVQMQGERFEQVVATQRRYSRGICCAWGTSLNSQAARLGPHCRENREAGQSLTGVVVCRDRQWLREPADLFPVDGATRRGNL